MRKLNEYIKEALSQDELNYKLNTWLQSRPDEQSLWDDACKSWKETRQVDDDAVKRFMDGTDVRSFVDFMNDSVNNDGIHSDDFSVIKKIITNI